MEIDKKEYGKYVKQVTPVHNTWKNLWRAFLVGGLICMLGQVFTSVYMSFFFIINNHLSVSYVLLLLSSSIFHFMLVSKCIRFF